MGRKVKLDAAGQPVPPKPRKPRAPSAKKETKAPSEPVAEASQPAPAEVAPLTQAQEDLIQETLDSLGDTLVEPAAEKPAPQAPPTRKLQASNPEDEILDLENAASTMVKGYKESWRAAIAAKARSMGIGDRASKREWKGVFVAWGGHSILR